MKNKTKTKKFKTYPIGYFHIDIAQLQTRQGKLYMFVAIDRTSKFALGFVEIHEMGFPKFSNYDSTRRLLIF